MRPIRITVLLAGLAAAAMSAAQLSWTGRSSVQPGFWTARATFPKWDAGSPLEQLVSAAVERDAEALLSGFVADNRRGGRDPQGRTYTFDLTTTLAHVGPEVISLTHQVFVYTGGAHPNTLHLPQTYGILRGRPALLAWRDVVRPGVDPARSFLDAVLPELNRMKRARGADPTDQLDSTLRDGFLATPAGITWQFGPYVAGSYAEGTYNVKVPWSALAGVVDSEGPLGRFAPAVPTTLSGTYSLPEGRTLPMNARLRIRLVAGGAADVASSTVGAGPNGGDFELALSPEARTRLSGASLVLEAVVADQVVFQSKPTVPTPGRPARIALEDAVPSTGAGDAEMARYAFVRLAGEAFFLERIAVPSPSRMVLRLLDAEGKAVAEEILPARSGRTPFDVAFDRRGADRNSVRQLVIELQVEGKPWFRSAPSEVPYDGWEAPREIRLIRVSG